MTDNEIIKALEYCRRTDRYVICNSNCPMYEYCESDEENEMNICGLALDLVNRQNAKIERLSKRVDGQKTRTLKEFAERLNEKLGDCHTVSDGEYCGFDCGDIHKCIDNLAKEMTESEEK